MAMVHKVGGVRPLGPLGQDILYEFTPKKQF